MIYIYIYISVPRALGAPRARSARSARALRSWCGDRVRVWHYSLPCQRQAIDLDLRDFFCLTSTSQLTLLSGRPLLLGLFENTARYFRYFGGCVIRILTVMVCGNGNIWPNLPEIIYFPLFYYHLGPMEVLKKSSTILLVLFVIKHVKKKYIYIYMIWMYL